MTAKPRKTAPKKAAAPAPKDDLTRPGKFSLEALLDGRLNPVKSHRVTVDPETAAKIERLRNERAEIELAMGQVEDLTQSKRRLAQKDTRKERIREIDTEIESLLPTLDGTWLEVQYRPLTALEQDDIVNAKHRAGAAITAHMSAYAGQVHPDGSDDEDDWSTLTVKEWLQLFDAIGIPQYQALDRILGDLTYSGRMVTPDFFGPSSKSQPTAGS